METLVYVSRAVGEVTDAGLRELLAEARAHNLATGLTGMLLYAAGSFMQQLEGEAEALERTFARIECDHRHAEVRVLSRRPVAARRFADWSMGFERPRAQTLRAHLPGYRESLSAPLIDAELVRDSSMAESLLWLYARSP